MQDSSHWRHRPPRPTSPRAKKTNQVGQAAFLQQARKQAFGKRLVMITLAQTPKAKAKKNTSVRIPRLAKPAAKR